MRISFYLCQLCCTGKKPLTTTGLSIDTKAQNRPLSSISTFLTACFSVSSSKMYLSLTSCMALSSWGWISPLPATQSRINHQTRLDYVRVFRPYHPISNLMSTISLARVLHITETHTIFTEQYCAYPCLYPPICQMCPVSSHSPKFFNKAPPSVQSRQTRWQQPMCPVRPEDTTWECQLSWTHSTPWPSTHPHQDLR